MGQHTTPLFDSITRTVSLGRGCSLDPATLTYSQRSAFLSQFAGTRFTVVQGLEAYDRSSIVVDEDDPQGTLLLEKQHLFEIDLLLKLKVYDTISIQQWRRGAVCSSDGELPLRNKQVQARLPLRICRMLPRLAQSILLQPTQQWIKMHDAVPRTESTAGSSFARAAQLLKIANDTSAPL